MRPESEIEDAVAERFRRQEETENVECQVYQPGPRWFVDIVVRYPWATLYIEVENDWPSVRDGIGQATGYAASDPSGVPVVAFPASVVEQPDLRLLQEGPALLRPFDVEAGEFVDA